MKSSEYYRTNHIRLYEFLARKEREHGARWDPSELADKFGPAFSSGERIRVEFPWGEVRTGTVGVTTGWRPVFLLMLSSRSRGSSYILDDRVKFTSAKVTRGER